MRSLVAKAPADVVRRMLLALLPRDPSIAAFCEQAVARVCYAEIHPAPCVSSIARDLAMSPRSLERLCRNARLPHPKELLDWITLLVVRYTALATRARTSTVAAHLGLDGQKLWRLRCRLAKLAPLLLREGSDPELEQLLLGFAERCGIDRGHAASIAQRIA